MLFDHPNSHNHHLALFPTSLCHVPNVVNAAAPPSRYILHQFYYWTAFKLNLSFLRYSNIIWLPFLSQILPRLVPDVITSCARQCACSCPAIEIYFNTNFTIFMLKSSIFRNINVIWPPFLSQILPGIVPDVIKSCARHYACFCPDPLIHFDINFIIEAELDLYCHFSAI